MVDAGTAESLVTARIAASRETGVPACPNCGSTSVASYCAECGERQPSRADYSARHLAREAYEEFVNVDGRLWRSIVALLSRPGFLTAEHFAGRKARYMRPFSLFVLLNVAFFFVQPRTGLLRYDYAMYVDNDHRAALATAKQRELFLNTPHFEQVFDATVQDQKRSLLLFAVPLFALALTVLYLGSGRTYVEHLVFSVHSYAFILFYVTAIGTVFFLVLGRLGAALPSLWPAVRWLAQEPGLDIVLFAGIAAYLFLAMRRFYGTSTLPATLRAALMFGVFGGLLVTFRDILFYTTLLAL